MIYKNAILVKKMKSNVKISFFAKIFSKPTFLKKTIVFVSFFQKFQTNGSFVVTDEKRNEKLKFFLIAQKNDKQLYTFTFHTLFSFLKIDYF